MWIIFIITIIDILQIILLYQNNFNEEIIISSNHYNELFPY